MRGERSGRAILTEVAVEQIRKERAENPTDRYLVGRLAIRYGVHPATIYAVLKGTNWSPRE